MSDDPVGLFKAATRETAWDWARNRRKYFTTPQKDLTNALLVGAAGAVLRYGSGDANWRSVTMTAAAVAFIVAVVAPQVETLFWLLRRKSILLDDAQEQIEKARVSPLNGTQDPQDASTPFAFSTESEVIRKYRQYLRNDFDHVESAFGRLPFDGSHVAAQVQVRRSPRIPNSHQWLRRRWALLELMEESAIASGERPSARIVRWLLLGEPGAGKTTEFRYLTFQLASHHRLVPIFISLPRLAEAAGFESLVPWALSKLLWDEKAKTQLANALERKARAGELVLLFDGFDEVPETSRSQCEGIIQQTLANLGDPIAIVSARHLGSQHQGGFEQIELLPFDRPQQLALVTTLLRDDGGEARAVQIVDDLSQSPIRSFSGNPLYVTLYVTLLREGRRPAETPLDLHLQFVDLLLGGLHRSSGRSVVNPDLAKQVLSELAIHMVREGRVDMVRSNMCAWLDANSFRLAPVAAAWSRSAAFLNEVAGVSNILIGASLNQAPWRFWHRAMRDALAAFALREELKHEAARIREEALRRDERTVSQQEIATATAVTEWSLLEARADAARGIEDHWAEVYALLVAQAPSPDDLITSLAKTSPSLALRALASSPPLRENTYTTILDFSPTVQERRREWQTCRKVIDGLEQQLEPERALELLHKIRSKFRDGNNLYFIARAYDRIAAKEERLLEMVRHHKTRLFEHLPKPQEAWFTHTPGSDRPFLTHVQSGECRAPLHHNGSPTEYTLTIKRPFKLSAVSVTNEMFGRFSEGRPPGKSAFAATSLTWYEALAFCEWLAQLPAFAEARLPFEAEWEFACLQGHGPGEFVSDQRETASLGPVAQDPCDRIGLFDMIGHAECWCADEWAPSAMGRTAVVHDPCTAAITHIDGQRAVRGGLDEMGPVRYRLPWERRGARPSLPLETTGFRVLVPSAGE